MKWLSQLVIDTALLSMLEHPEYRWGQALFNAYYEIAPDLANQVRGTENDPFYAKDMKDQRLVNFFEFLQNNNVELHKDKSEEVTDTYKQVSMDKKFNLKEYHVENDPNPEIAYLQENHGLRVGWATDGEGKYTIFIEAHSTSPQREGFYEQFALKESHSSYEAIADIYDRTIKLLLEKVGYESTIPWLDFEKSPNVQLVEEELPKDMLVPLKDEYIISHDSDRALKEGIESMMKTEFEEALEAEDNMQISFQKKMEWFDWVRKEDMPFEVMALKMAKYPKAYAALTNVLLRLEEVKSRTQVGIPTTYADDMDDWEVYLAKYIFKD